MTIHILNHEKALLVLGSQLVLQMNVFCWTSAVYTIEIVTTHQVLLHVLICEIAEAMDILAWAKVAFFNYIVIAISIKRIILITNPTSTWKQSDYSPKLHPW